MSLNSSTGSSQNSHWKKGPRQALSEPEDTLNPKQYIASFWMCALNKFFNDADFAMSIKKIHKQTNKKQIEEEKSVWCYR